MSTNNNSIIPFDFEGNKIRIIRDENNELHFIANDLIKPLGLSHIRQHLARLDDDEKGVTISDTPGGKQEVATVTEPGLYRLIFASRKDEAKRFKRWVYHEVLTAIRKQGGYISPDATGEQLKMLQMELDKAQRQIADLKQVTYWLGVKTGAGRFLEKSLPDSDRD